MPDSPGWLRGGWAAAAPPLGCWLMGRSAQRRLGRGPGDRGTLRRFAACVPGTPAKKSPGF